MNLDGRELAGILTDTALDTDISVDLVRFLDLSGNGTYRTLPGTCRTSDTLIRVDLIADELLALSGWALLVNDVSLILLWEVVER